MRLVRAHRRAADFVEDVNNRAEVAALLGQLQSHRRRGGSDPPHARRRLKVSPEGAYRTDPRYLLVGREAAGRPEPRQAAWLYAQMVRWGQAPLSRELLAAAKAVCRSDLYDAALPAEDRAPALPADGIGAFAGPPFDPDNIEAHLAAWTIKRQPAG